MMTSTKPADVSSMSGPDLGPSCDPDEAAISDPDLSVGAAELSSLERECRHQLSAAPRQSAARRARLHNRLGLLLYGQVRFDEAAQEYTAALQAWPRLAAAAYNRGIVRYRMGCFREAEQDLQLALSLAPDHPEIATGLRETRRLMAGGPLQAAAQAAGLSVDGPS